MTEENKMLTAGRSAGPPSVMTRVGLPMTVIIVGGGVIASLVAGVYWLGAVLTVGGIALFFRIAKVKTAQHEASLSLPPALASMKQKLGSLNLEPSLSPSAKRAQNQLQRLESGLKQASELLARKLDTGELAYSRFQTSFQNAASAVFSELQDTVDFLTQAALAGAKEPASEPHKAQAIKCLDENEKALETFSAALTAVAKMETNSARVALPEAIHELEQIAARAKHLSLNQGE